MNVKYIPGVTVQAIEESSTSVTLHAIDQDGSKCQFTGERALLLEPVYSTQPPFYCVLSASTTPQ